jgi:hypothetical protein
LVEPTSVAVGINRVKNSMETTSIEKAKAIICLKRHYPFLPPHCFRRRVLCHVRRRHRDLLARRCDAARPGAEK